MRDEGGEARNSRAFVIERRLDATGEFESSWGSLIGRRLDATMPPTRGEPSFFVASGLPPMKRRPERCGRAERGRRPTKLAGFCHRAKARCYRRIRIFPGSLIGRRPDATGKPEPLWFVYGFPFSVKIPNGKILPTTSPSPRVVPRRGGSTVDNDRQGSRDRVADTGNGRHDGPGAPACGDPLSLRGTGLLLPAGSLPCALSRNVRPVGSVAGE